MTWKGYGFLFIIGLGVSSIVACTQSLPGYMDSDYYFAGGLQLVKGNGFNEPYLWNYLDDPAGLPHPSHSYWMPLSSILAAASMFVTGQHTYAAARMIFILIAACVPLMTARLSQDFNGDTNLAFTSGLLAVFSIFHAPFMPVTDNFAPVMALGAFIFLLLKYNSIWSSLLMGCIAGLMNLARSDGLIWIALLCLFVVWRAQEEAGKKAHGNNSFVEKGLRILAHLSLVFIGYFLIMTPWFLRNMAVFGSPMAPGGGRILWLTNYNDTFAFPADQVNFSSWLNAGWQAAIKTRIWALGMNFLNAIGAQGGILLFPFILTGIWIAKSDLRIKLAVLGWLLLFATLIIFFPFAGARGGFFHAGVAFQPLWWALAPLGLEHIVRFIRHRGFLDERAYCIFRAGLVMICALLTIVVLQKRIFQLGWQDEEFLYMEVEQFLLEQGAKPEDIVIALNPPGYYIVSGRSAIVAPPGGPDTIVALAERYGASYFILEPQGVLSEYKDLYNRMENHTGIEYIGEVELARIYEISLDK